MYKNILILGRGIGQVMFQNNALSGGLMLLGIAFNSWQLAVLSVLGTVVSTLTASLSGYDFNGTLVGIAIGVFMEINVTSILLLISGSAFSTWVARCFRYQNRVSGLTAPFIFVVWLLLVGCHYLYPSLLLSSSLEKPELTMDLLKYRSGDVSGKYTFGIIFSFRDPD